jgi:hypothetical protein
LGVLESLPLHIAVHGLEHMSHEMNPCTHFYCIAYMHREMLWIHDLNSRGTGNKPRSLYSEEIEKSESDITLLYLSCGTKANMIGSMVATFPKRTSGI